MKQNFLDEHFKVNQQGMYQLLESGNAFDTSSLKICQKSKNEKNLKNPLHFYLAACIIAFAVA